MMSVTWLLGLPVALVRAALFNAQRGRLDVPSRAILEGREAISPVR